MWLRRTVERRRPDLDVEAEQGVRCCGAVAVATTFLTDPCSSQTANDPDDWTVFESLPNSSIEEESGACRILSSDGSLASIQQNVLVSGKKYTLRYRVVRNSGGGLKIKIGATEQSVTSTEDWHEVEFTADGTSFEFIRDGVTDISIDGASLKETLAAGTLVYRHLRGTVVRAIRNPEGKSKMVRLECLPSKGLLSTAMGIVVQNQCPWIFGQRGCGIDTGPLKESGTIDSIDGKKVTVSGLTTTTTDRYWHRGFVERDGLKIGIREYTTGNEFELIREPPSDWEAQVGIFTPGCDKYIETCRARWDNESNFGGSGYAIPNVHPIIEQR